MGHHDPAGLVEGQVTGPRQVSQAPGDRLDVGAGLPRELRHLWCATRLRERAIYRQPQVLVVHRESIFAEPVASGP